MRRTRFFLGIACALTLTAIGTQAEAQRVVGDRPDPRNDEGGIWSEAEKAENVARNSAELNTDPRLNTYVREVACKVAAEYCEEVRVYILDRPFFNATAAPNGYIEIWSGSLLRMNDEAELAFVLGHEISHFTHNHSIKSWRTAKTRANAAMVFAIGVGVAISASNYNSTTGVSSAPDNLSGLVDIFYLGALASMMSFSREQEFEADRLGQDRMAQAGYAAQAASSVWGDRMAETQASDFPQVRKTLVRTGVFNSHPLSEDRMEALSQRSAEGGEHAPDRLRSMIRPHISAWLRDDLRRRDYGQTLHIIARLAERGEDLGVLNFYKAECYRLRRADGDVERAIEGYAAAAAQPDAPLATWRELGDLRVKTGDKAGAAEAYETYLSKAADAEDAWIVKDSLKAIGTGE